MHKPEYFRIGGLTIAVLWIVLLPSVTATIPRYDTNLTCMAGRDRSKYLDIDCYDLARDGIIYVTRVIHGLTPNTSGCDVVAPRATCCPDPADPARDCVFSSSAEKLLAMRDKCNGLFSCWTTIRGVPVGDAQCPDREGLSYGRTSEFARVEFMCPRFGMMSDVCDNDVTMTGSGVYLETNFVNNNRHHSNKTCSCVMATTCGHKLMFKVLDMNLTKDANGTCTEQVVLREGDASSTVLATFNCSYNPLQSSGGGAAWEGTVVVSETSVVTFHLDLMSDHAGIVLIHVTATNGAPVEVLCGQPANQTLLNATSCRTAPVKDLISPDFNSTEACLQGTGETHDFEIDCLKPDIQGLIYVERIFHGLTPDVMGCDVTGPKNSCCPGYDSTRDCLISTEQGLSDLREMCDGAEACYPNLRKMTVTDECPARREAGRNVTYGPNSYFAFVQYKCINTGLMNDVCHAGIILRDTEIYLESNVLNHNTHLANTQCTCHLSARCGQRLLFHVLDLRLTAAGGAGSCPEELVVVDMTNTSVAASLDCNSSQAMPVQREDGIEPWFQSQSHLVRFQLRLGDRHQGKLLLRVTASDGSIVAVRCGRTTDLDVWEQHRCNDSFSSSPSSISVPASSTSATVVGSSSTPSSSTKTSLEKEEKADDDITTEIAIGTAVVGFLVILLVIVVVVVLWRGRKRAPNNDDNSHAVDDYDNNAVQYVVPPAPCSATPNNASHSHAFANAMYVSSPYPGGAEGDDEKHAYDNLSSEDGQNHVYDNPGSEKPRVPPDAGSPPEYQQGAVGGEGVWTGVGYGNDMGAVGLENPAFENDNALNLRILEKGKNA